MDGVTLGSTSLTVSRFCLGMENADMSHLAPMLHEAAACGINWWDYTGGVRATMVRDVLHEQKRDTFIVSAHSHAHTHQEVMESLVKHLAALQVEYLDILFLQDVRTLDDLNAREDAVVALQEAKSRGSIAAMGIHTHNPQVMRYAAEKRRFDVVMASLDDEGFAMGDWLPQIDASLRAAQKAGAGVVVTDILQGRDGRQDPLGTLHWAVDHPAIQVMRFTPATTRELAALAQLVEERTVEPQRVKFLWQRAA